MRIPTRCLLLLPCLLLVLIAHPQTHPYDTAQQYPKSALQADLRFVHTNLEKKHPGLYLYCSKRDLDRFFDSLDHAITGPMTPQQFYPLLTLLHSRIGNGHTMFLPGDSAMAWLNRCGKLLPLKVFFSNGTLTILENYSADSTLHVGSEILRINGVSVANIMEQLMQRQVRDGYNRTYPLWILNHYFPSYYSFVFGQPAGFTMDLKEGNGKPSTIKINALTKDSIAYYRQLRYAARYPDKKGQGIVLQEEKNAAVLTIKTFDADLLQSVYAQDYKKTFDSVFTQISRHQPDSLILDLRDNQGGDFAPARRLLSYLIMRPSRFLLDGKEARIISPAANHFKGQLIVLINGGSFSVTAIVCACLKRDKRALFIGEETGGNIHVITGDPVELMLPHTKIKAEISTTTYRINTDFNDGHGLMPDRPDLPAGVSHSTIASGR